MSLPKNKKIYLDYAATTPVDPCVLKAMMPYFSKKFGNSASLHSFGQEAFETLENSRKTIAGIINAAAPEIFFTSSATESNNMAIRGTAVANQNKGRHIVISAIEHDCVLNAAQYLGKNGFSVSYVKPGPDGLITVEEIKKSLTPQTILVSVIHANNEIGTIQDINAIGALCRQKGIIFHTDASQSFGREKIDVKAMNIDLLTASSHKIYGPKGAALLYKRRGVAMEPLLYGGGHESGLRSSTVNIPAIVGFAKAAEIMHKMAERENGRLVKLRDYAISEILRRISGTHLNGHPTKRLANNINIRFDYVEGESLLMELDARGIAVSTASACSSPKLEPSHVLLACGIKPEEAHGSLRISLGRFTTMREIKILLVTLSEAVSKLRKMSPFKIKGK